MKFFYALGAVAASCITTPAPAQTAPVAPADSSRGFFRHPRWYVAPSAGVALTHLRLRRYTGYDETLFERSYLSGQDLDRGPRLLLGAQGGVVLAHGHLALHTEHELRRFGTYQQTFDTGHPDFPEKTYYARGAALSSGLTVRYLHTYRRVQWFGGLGLSRLTLLGLRSGSYYNGVDRREAYGLSLPTDGQFLQQWQHGHGYGSFHPVGGLYFEAGSARGRWSLTWSYRHTWYGLYMDDNSVYSFPADRLTGQITRYTTGYQYSLRPVAFCWTAAYRLNR
ncbi:hypothetical protein LJ737_13640 [Hymenobacter sp. 15J16-1T3B]|uniref:hypothetical protein n=1 Tax=Hymenobacter sp. 15J16-1T3B TaxID=2886941 RepID=UPI001D0FE60E|nr:hypothetical protein [Hymenobacter sp. 15J16-1T3B]MCC3158286.1 hypothetical protein [Hymenobacter sp. 15J16-1T3B]